MDQPQIIEDNQQPFIIKVKLLSDEVYEFKVDKNMKISQFKEHIAPKVNVPVDRMRIVFAGKQLLDDKPLSQYVTESGTTVHLIARTAPVVDNNNNNQNAQSAQNVASSQQGQSQGQSGQNSQVPPRNAAEMQPNPFGDIMGMVNSLFGGQQTGSNPPPQITMSFGTMNNPMGQVNPMNLLSGLGLRIPNQPPQPQPQPPQPQQPSNQPSARISYQPLSTLNLQLNTLNIPLDSVTLQNQTLSPQQVVRYLRRLHHQSTRSMLQLNRILNIIETQNYQNIGLLDGFVPVFRSINQANNVAVGCISQLQQQRNRGGQQQAQQTQQQTQQQQAQQVQPSVVRIGITVPDPTNNPQIVNPTHSQPQTQSQSQSSQPQTQPRPQSQTQPQQAQQPQQMPFPMQINPLQMMGGLDMGALMGGLQSVGGIGGLFGMSLRDMMSQNGTVPQGIFIDIFGGMTGQHMMQMFTTKDIKFLNQKQPQIRQKLIKRINQKSLQQVVDDITQQASQILVPKRPYPIIKSYQQCKQKCLKSLRKNVHKLVQISLKDDNPQYYIKVADIGKRAFSQNIMIIAENSENNQSGAFQIVKLQTLAVLDPVLPGIAGMFYGLLERDLLRIYNQYKAEEERKKQMSKEDEQSEEKLIELIKQAGARDSQKMAQIKHSDKYHQ